MQVPTYWIKFYKSVVCAFSITNFISVQILVNGRNCFEQMSQLQ